MKIQIIDDEIDFAETLAERLEIRDHQVTIAHSGTTGLTCIQNETPDVVLLDINMPDLTGIEVLEKLAISHPTLPVLMLTGHAYSSHKEEALAKGARECLTKPIELAELLEKIAIL